MGTERANAEGGGGGFLFLFNAKKGISLSGGRYNRRHSADRDTCIFMVVASTAASAGSYFRLFLLKKQHF